MRESGGDTVAQLLADYWEIRIVKEYLKLSLRISMCLLANFTNKLDLEALALRYPPDCMNFRSCLRAKVNKEVVSLACVSKHRRPPSPPRAEELSTTTCTADRTIFAGRVHLYPSQALENI